MRFLMIKIYAYDMYHVWYVYVHLICSPEIWGTDTGYPRIIIIQRSDVLQTTIFGIYAIFFIFAAIYFIIQWASWCFR